MNIYFIRHGDPDYTTDSLTELGHAQAKKVANVLKSIKIDEIYQSSMGRAKQTCSYIAEKCKITPVTLEWAQELCWGDKSGDAWATDSPWSIINKLIKNEHAYPQGEEWKNLPDFKNDRIVEDIENRCSKLDEFLEENGYIRKGQLYQVKEPNNKNIAIVCHGGVSCAFISHLINLPFLQMIAHTGLKCTSISKIKLVGGKDDFTAAQLEYLNDYKHLSNN